LQEGHAEGRPIGRASPVAPIAKKGRPIRRAPPTASVAKSWLQVAPCTTRPCSLVPPSLTPSPLGQGWGPLLLTTPCSHYFWEDYKTTVCHPWLPLFAPNHPSAQGQKVKFLLVSHLEVVFFAFLLLLFFPRLWPHVANNVTNWISNITLPYFPTFC
jgi:hypothetical protein